MNAQKPPHPWITVFYTSVAMEEGTAGFDPIF